MSHGSPHDSPPTPTFTEPISETTMQRLSLQQQQQAGESEMSFVMTSTDSHVGRSAAALQTIPHPTSQLDQPIQQQHLPSQPLSSPPLSTSPHVVPLRDGKDETLEAEGVGGGGATAVSASLPPLQSRALEAVHSFQQPHRESIPPIPTLSTLRAQFSRVQGSIADVRAGSQSMIEDPRAVSPDSSQQPPQVDRSHDFSEHGADSRRHSVTGDGTMVNTEQWDDAAAVTNTTVTVAAAAEQRTRDKELIEIHQQMAELRHLLAISLEAQAEQRRTIEALSVMGTPWQAPPSAAAIDRQRRSLAPISILSHDMGGDHSDSSSASSAAVQALSRPLTAGAETILPHPLPPHQPQRVSFSHEDVTPTPVQPQIVDTMSPAASPPRRANLPAMVTPTLLPMPVVPAPLSKLDAASWRAFHQTWRTFRLNPYHPRDITMGMCTSASTLAVLARHAGKAEEELIACSDGMFAELVQAVIHPGKQHEALRAIRQVKLSFPEQHPQHWLGNLIEYLQRIEDLKHEHSAAWPSNSILRDTLWQMLPSAMKPHLELEHGGAATKQWDSLTAALLAYCQSLLSPQAASPWATDNMAKARRGNKSNNNNNNAAAGKPQEQGPRPSLPTCAYCHRYGHAIDVCHKRQRDQDPGGGGGGGGASGARGGASSNKGSSAFTATTTTATTTNDSSSKAKEKKDKKKSNGSNKEVTEAYSVAFRPQQHQVCQDVQADRRRASAPVILDHPSIAASIWNRGPPVNGELPPEQPIAFASRALTDVESRWSPVEVELWVLIWALEKFRHLHLGFPITVYSDCQSLRHLHSESPKLLRWRLKLQNFCVTIKHIAGVYNEGPDGMSRCFLVLTADMNALFRRVHGHAVGHFGVDVTVFRLGTMGKRFPGDRAAAKTYIAACAYCQKQNPVPASTGSAPFKTIAVSEPWHTIAIDMVGPFPEDSQGNKFVHVLIDCFSRFVFLVPTPKATAKHAARALLQVVGLFGCPSSIQSDRGVNYTANVTTALIKYIGSDHHITALERPQSNGAVERCIRELLRHLRILVQERRVHEDWSVFLPLCQRIINSTTHSGTGVAPLRLLFPLITPDRMILHPLASDPEAPEVEVDSLISELVKVQREMIVLAQQHQEQAVSTRLASGPDEPVVPFFAPHTLVLARYAARPPNKLSPRLRGPLEVISTRNTNMILTRELTANQRLREYHVSQLIPFDPTLTPDPFAIAALDCDEYVIEAIVSHRPVLPHYNQRQSKALEFEVKWMYYDHVFNTWESLSNLNQTAALSDYIALHPPLAVLGGV